MSPDDPFWDDRFHGCAWAAYVEAARACGGPPPIAVVRARAYRIYEDELARRGAARDAAAIGAPKT